MEKHAVGLRFKAQIKKQRVHTGHTHLTATVNANHEK